MSKVCRGYKKGGCIVTPQEQPLCNFFKSGGYYKNTCKKCEAYGKKLRYQKDPTTIREVNTRSYQKNKDSWNKKREDYYKKFYQENLEKEKARKSLWKRANRPLVAAQAARRRASVKNRTPEWLTEDHLQEIKQKYWLAKDCEVSTGEPYHVDHIIPLNGDSVSGLHVPWNLQVLPADINMKKSNHYDTEKSF